MTTAPARTVLVTGAMGQVGKRATQILLDRGRTVIALDLHNPATEKVAASFDVGTGMLVPAYVDLLDSAALTALLAEHRPDAIVHLAAVVAPPAYRNPRLARRVNVEGTANLVAAALALPDPPLFLEASSSGVYGSRNPHTRSDRLTAGTPVNPVECYGEDKVRAEQVVAASGLPFAVLRIGGIISPDTLRSAGPDYAVMMRAFPNDGRIHAVDARDVALAFANAVDRGPTIDGKTLLIGGNETCALVQHVLEDDLAAAVGIGRLGPEANLPGDPDDERGWGLTDWFDTTESQALLEFQEHDWDETCAWVADSVGPLRSVLAVLGPVLRPTLRWQRRRQRVKDGRGRYADPWRLIASVYGAEVLAPTDW